MDVCGQPWKTIWGSKEWEFRFCERAVELHGVLPLSHEPVDSLWVKIQGQMNRGDIIVDICYRPPKQEEEDETFRQVHNALYLQVLILMRDFSYPTVRQKQHHSRTQAFQEVSGMNW